MDILLLIQMIVAAILGTVLYTLIGVAPGTDETAVLAPVTLAIVLAGVHPMVVLCFFIAAIVAKKLTDSIPVAVAGIPGGVMAAPMVEHAVQLKSLGYADTSIRKMASGSVIGTLVSVPLSLLLARALIPLGPVISKHAGLIFFLGAIFLALMAREKLISLLIIVPFGVLITALRHFYWGIGAVPEGTTPFVSFFLAITIGPMILNMLELAVGNKRKEMERADGKLIELAPEKPHEGKIPNPFAILDGSEKIGAVLASILGTISFFMSPVGMTIFIGESIAARVKDVAKKASMAISTMDAVTNASYLAGTLIPLIALGVPLSPMAIGPANALFNAPPVLTLEKNLHHILTFGNISFATVLGAIIAIIITYPITIKYSRPICLFVFKRIPHESLLAMFFTLVMILAYMDAGFSGMIGVIVLSMVAGVINRWGVNYGVQFMVLYAAPWMVSTFFGG